ncbi:hypothetical protein HDU81_005672 [Chytriomyces hyalinus]|nr:hypothetical protein HDU81_005672 [Chytriomyces hyalinus]
MVKNQIRQIANELQDMFSSHMDGMQSSSTSKNSRVVGQGDVVYAPVAVQNVTVALHGQQGVMDSRQHIPSIRTQVPASGEDILPPYKEFDSKSNFE